MKTPIGKRQAASRRSALLGIVFLFLLYGIQDSSGVIAVPDYLGGHLVSTEARAGNNVHQFYYVNNTYFKWWNWNNIMRNGGDFMTGPDAVFMSSKTYLDTKLPKVLSLFNLSGTSSGSEHNQSPQSGSSEGEQANNIRIIHQVYGGLVGLVVGGIAVYLWARAVMPNI
jgi:hypothetical protein